MGVGASRLQVRVVMLDISSLSLLILGRPGTAGSSAISTPTHVTQEHALNVLPYLEREEK